MRHPFLFSLCMFGIVATAACDKPSEESVNRKIAGINVIDESNLNDVMLTVADPNEAVSYFQRAVSDDPKRIDHLRGLANSLVRARRVTEAVGAWDTVIAHPDSNEADQVDLADAKIRGNDWKGAEVVLDNIPPTHETYKRYRLEAMIADSNREWKKADSFYETAAGLTTKPAGVMNNWGYSMLTRGEFKSAERLFGDAIRQDQHLFTAKNNLVLARGAQRNYELPVIPMSQIERAQLLHTLGLSAVKQGDIETAKGLLRNAIETHPQHFESAVRSLRALEES
jgi:Tfp pilus assembly protein PilF